MKKTKEMKLYELLGIKQFRQMAFKFRNILFAPFLIKMTEEEKKQLLNDAPTNYNIGKDKSLRSVKEFKKWLFINAIIHVIGLYYCIPGFLRIVNNNATLLGMFITGCAITINSYCIMLQRYNCIKLNKTIKILEKREERKQSRMKKQAKLINRHEYKEENMSFENFLETASIDQLKEYKKQLLILQETNSLSQNNKSDSKQLKSKVKTLKLK